MPHPLMDEPIRLPRSPLVESLASFGRDEALALVINTVATAVAAVFFSNPVVLALAGPVLEKLGFFPAHLYEGHRRRKTTHPSLRKRRSWYFKKALREGSSNLLADLLLHDPLYILLFGAGYLLWPGTPVWLVSAVAFILAAVLVSGIQVAYVELRYWRFRRLLREAGFQEETYLETRFFIDAKKPPRTLVNELREAFSLGPLQTHKYLDFYYANTIQDYAGRKASTRIRENSWRDGEVLRTAQIVFTRAREAHGNGFEQYRFYPLKKSKLTYRFEEMPESLTAIDEPLVQRRLQTFMQDRAHHKISFERVMAWDEELLVTADTVPEHGGYFIELKVYSDVTRLLQAMRYVMQEYPVRQITHGKYEMTRVLK